jgi:hypothetical protein
MTVILMVMTNDSDDGFDDIKDNDEYDGEDDSGDDDDHTYP